MVLKANKYTENVLHMLRTMSYYHWLRLSDKDLHMNHHLKAVTVTTIFEATKNAVKKAIDSCTSTYSLNIVDYTYEATERLGMKYIVLELKNDQLHKSS